MSLRRLLHAALPCAALVVAAACNDVNAPEPIFSLDEQTPIDRVSALSTVFDQPSIVSLNNTLTYVDVLFGFGQPPAHSTLGKAELPSRPGTGLFRSLEPIAPNFANEIIAEALGKTYVFGNGSFVPDPSLTGAPANGVRFVMHGWEATASTPTLPLTRLGYVDFTPVVIAASTDALRARLVRDEGNIVLADYTISHTTTGDTQTLEVNGSLNDGAKSVLIAATHSSTITATSNTSLLSSTVSDPSRGVAVSMQLSSDGSQGSVAVQIAYDGHLLEAVFAPSIGEVRLDGRLYANARFGGANGPEYTKADGTPFTGQESGDLNAVISIAQLSAIRFHDLVWF